MPNGVVTKGINNEIVDGDFLELDGGVVRWEDIVGLLVGIIY